MILLTDIFSGFEIWQAPDKLLCRGISECYISQIIKEAIKNPTFNVEKNLYLDFPSFADTTPVNDIDEFFPEEDGQGGDIIGEKDSVFTLFAQTSVESTKRAKVDFKCKQEAVVYWEEMPNKWPFTSNQYRFRKVSPLRELRRWKTEIEKDGNHPLKPHQMGPWKRSRSTIGRNSSKSFLVDPSVK